MRTKLSGLVLAVVVGLLAPTTIAIAAPAPAVAANCADCDPGHSAGGGTTPAGSPGLCPTSGIRTGIVMKYRLSHCWVNVVAAAQLIWGGVAATAGVVALLTAVGLPVVLAAGLYGANLIRSAVELLQADRKCGYVGAEVTFDLVGGAWVQPLC